ncbi:Cell division protein ftsB-like protein [Oxalobacteraceae bacterium IMCC9480]|nr:Cell division protein ftsB-like protein [Oxalobacteraceae bacterium IMCC9480]
MRLILTCLAALLLLIQYPLWFGKGGWLRVADLDQQVTAAVKKTEDLKARNAKLGSEVQDLKTGTGAVEERARYELGMVKENEVFVQVLPAGTAAPELAVKPVPAAEPLPPVRSTP